MSPQIIRRRVLLGGAVSALAFTPSRTAQADTTFTNFGFAATGAPTARTMPDRLADVINVKDWGAIGNGSNDDTAAIQAAISYALSTAGGKQAGGRVFFPCGSYKISPPGLIVGSTNPNADLLLVGSGRNVGTLISGNINGWLISKGSNPSFYDNLVAFEDINLVNGFAMSSRVPGTGVNTGCIKISGTVQTIKNSNMSGMVLIDASQANGCTIFNVYGGGNDSRGSPDGINTANSIYPEPRYGIGIYLGNSCVAMNCRLQGSYYIGFALSGTGAAALACGAESGTIGARLGWAPGIPLTMTASGAAGNTTLTFGGGKTGVVTGMTASGWNIADGTMVTNVTSNSVTIAPGLTGALPSGSVVVFTVDAPAKAASVQGLQTERTVQPIDLFNCQGCLVAGNALTGQIGLPDPQLCTLSWVPTGGGTVTVTTAAPHDLPSTMSNFPLVIDTTGTGIPNVGGAWTPTWFRYCTYVNSTSFTYHLAVNPGAGVSANWNYGLRYDMRFRKVRETAVIGNSNGVVAAYAEADFNYLGDSNTIHAYNIYQCNNGTSSGFFAPVTTRNLAGWSFAQYGKASLGVNSVATLTSLAGLMSFADLPSDSTGAVYQGGPIEGQEYTIKDCTLTASGNFAAVVGVGQSGGTNHVKVRYDGTSWRII